MSVVEEVKCSLSSLAPATLEIKELSANMRLLSKLRDEEIFKMHVSVLQLIVTITKSFELEESCGSNATLLHLKNVNRKWVGHIINPRTDIIIPFTKEPIGLSLMIVLETLAMTWSPVLFTPDTRRYKSLRKLWEQIMKSKKIIILPSVIFALMVCTAVVAAGSYYAHRTKQQAAQKSLQHRKAELLADWGQYSEASAEVDPLVDLDVLGKRLADDDQLLEQHHEYSPYSSAYVLL
ncbi:unnamed protein product [Heligmosomoides polygyrus]|uniref:Transmembrane protein n=1 Tax=Heligmosomoides polygyrus TaxID=6339 RepID=A0A183GVQ6_HELPZ|nr:unnamed protein product [Heligmosomoides polygyrus]